MKKIMFLVVFLMATTLCISNASGQALFLPQNLSTPNLEYLLDFAEGPNESYFFAGRTNTGSIDSGTSVINGTIYKLNKAGTLLKQFTAPGILGQRHIVFENVHVKENNVFVVATESKNVNGELYANTLLLLKLDTELNLLSTDTVFLENDSTRAQVINSILVQGRIIVGTHAPDFLRPGFTQNSFLTLFNLEGKKVSHQKITSTLVKDKMISDLFWVTSLTPQPGGMFSLNGFYERNDPNRPYIYAGIILDTALTIQNRIVLTDLQPPAGNSGIVFGNTEIWKPTDNSSYFFGPMVFGGAPMTLAHWVTTLSKIIAGQGTYTSAPAVDPPRITGIERWPGFKRPVALSKDSKTFTFLTTDNCDRFYQDEECALYVTQYDTSLQLKWSRSFQQPNTSFVPSGVYALSNKNLMVLASAYNFMRSPTTYYDLYAFILDSTGTPLSTFKVPNPQAAASVKVYPNPATNFIRFETPANAGTGTYFLRNATGALVQEGAYKSAASISVANLPAGVYFYQLRATGAQIFSGVFLKE